MGAPHCTWQRRTFLCKHHTTAAPPHHQPRLNVAQGLRSFDAATLLIRFPHCRLALFAVCSWSALPATVRNASLPGATCDDLPVGSTCTPACAPGYAPLPGLMLRLACSSQSNATLWIVSGSCVPGKRGLGEKGKAKGSSCLLHLQRRWAYANDHNHKCIDRMSLACSSKDKSTWKNFRKKSHA